MNVSLNIFPSAIYDQTPSTFGGPSSEGVQDHQHSWETKLEGQSPKCQLSKEKRAPSCLGYIGDEILHSYTEITINKPL